MDGAHDEDRHGLRVLLQLPGAVGVDIEQHVEPATERAPSSAFTGVP
jgi:hypothetical protein